MPRFEMQLTDDDKQALETLRAYYHAGSHADVIRALLRAALERIQTEDIHIEPALIFDNNLVRALLRDVSFIRAEIAKKQGIERPQHTSDYFDAALGG